MSPEHDQKLCNDFPEIFKDRHGGMRTTAMCWGFECGDGWYNIIRFLCIKLMQDYNRTKDSYEHYKEMVETEDKSQWHRWQIENYTEEKLATKKQELDNTTIPIAVQVKEKFGGLRFYVNRATDKQHDMISFTESLSHYVCEECGTMKDVHCYDMGWIRTLCRQHANERYGEEAVKEYHEG
jgi:hypothetical protein